MLRSVRTKLLISSATSIACCILFAAAHADVYKYKDEKGNVLYTDKPMFLPAERISVKTENSNIVDLNQQNDERKAATERDQTKKPAPASSEKGKSDKPTVEGKAAACDKARTDYLARMNAQRLYEEQTGGERRYLSDKELDAARSSAKQAMDTLCN